MCYKILMGIHAAQLDDGAKESRAREEWRQGYVTWEYMDAERFIMLTIKEPFDYTKWRETNLDNEVSVRDLSKKAMEYASTLKE